MEWLLALLPYQKYGAFILASYAIGFLALLLLFVQFHYHKKNVITKLRHKYNREHNKNLQVNRSM